MAKPGTLTIDTKHCWVIQSKKTKKISSGQRAYIHEIVKEHTCTRKYTWITSTGKSVQHSDASVGKNTLKNTDHTLET